MSWLSRANRTFVFLIGAAALLLGTIACGTAQPTQATHQPAGSQPQAGGQKYPADFKFGVLLPVTGNSAATGKLVSDATVAAVGRINAAGGINGMKLEPVFYDTQGDSNITVPAYKRMIGVDKNNIALISYSSSIFAVGPMAKGDSAFLLNLAAPPTDLVGMGENVWHAVPSSEDEMKLAAAYAYQDLGLRQMATIFPQAEGNTIGAKFFAQYFEKAGGKIVAQETHPSGVLDFRPFLTKIQAANADGIWMHSADKDPGQIMKQAREMGMKQQFMGYRALDSNQTTDVAGKAAEGLVITSPYFDAKGQDTETKEFLEAVKKYANATYDQSYIGACSYDATNVLAAAMKWIMDNNRDLHEPQAYMDALMAVKDVPGVTGTATFNSKVASRPFSVKQVKDGQFVILKSIQ